MKKLGQFIIGVYIICCTVFATTLFVIYVAREKLGTDLFFGDWQIAAATTIICLVVAWGFPDA